MSRSSTNEDGLTNSETQPFFPSRLEENHKRKFFGREIKLECSRNRCVDLTKSYLPFLQWLPKYNLNWLQCDVIAGLTVGLTVIPQGLAYAQIAGLPVQYGLYSAFMGGFIYCLFGTSKDVTLGPTAIMSLLVHTYGHEDPVQAVLLTFLAGMIQLGMGLLRLGFIMRFISVPVISGFTSAAAITIALGQLKHIFGVKTTTNDFFPEMIQTFKNLDKANVWDVVMGLSCMVCLIVLRYIKDWIEPMSENDTRCQKICKKFIWLFSIGRNAVVVVSAGLVGYAIHTQHVKGCKVPDCLTLTGEIDEGLPPFRAPAFSEVVGNKTVTTDTLIGNIGVGLFVIPLMGLLESIAIGKAFARKNNYILHTNQEMIAIGTANVLSSFVSSYCITGSFSRTAINAQSDVKTPAGGIFTGLVVIISLALLTPYFYYIPKSALSAVIITAVIYMVDYKTVAALWKVKKIDLIPLAATFLVCFWEIPYGILAGVGVSLLIMMYPNTFPTVPHLHMPKSRRDSDQRCVLIFTPEQGVYYPGAEYITDKIRSVINERQEVEDVRGIIIDGAKLSHLDFTAILSFIELAEELDKKEVEITISNLEQDLLEDLRKADVRSLIQFDSFSPELSGSLD